MVPSDAAGQQHPDHVGGQHRLAARPQRDAAHAEEREQDEFGLQLRHPSSVSTEEAGRDDRQQEEHDRGHEHEDQRPEREGREDEAERQHGAEIVHEAGGEDRLAVLRDIEAELEHHRIDHGDRSGRQRHPGEPTRADVPPKHVPGRRGRAQERCHESSETDDERFVPLQSKHIGIQLGAGEERQDDGAGPGEKRDPGR